MVNFAAEVAKGVAAAKAHHAEIDALIAAAPKCEQCEEQPAVRYGLCRDCEHQDDTEFYDYDPGAEF